jgi:hypothetical protein
MQSGPKAHRTNSRTKLPLKESLYPGPAQVAIINLPPVSVSVPPGASRGGGFARDLLYSFCCASMGNKRTNPPMFEVIGGPCSVWLPAPTYQDEVISVERDINNGMLGAET